MKFFSFNLLEGVALRFYSASWLCSQTVQVAPPSTLERLSEKALSESLPILQIPCKEIPSENALRVNLPSFARFLKNFASL